MSLVTRLLVGFFVMMGLLVFPGLSYAYTHTVVAGESLYTISRSNGISLSSLMEANGLTGSLIYPGQKLYIPGKSSIVHTVKAGDTLYLLGQWYGVSYQAIMSANRLYDTTIYPGMDLTIPTAANGASSNSGVSRGGYFTRPSAADIDLLARLITAEADGEPYEGKVAVGAVVLNRIDNPDFPNSIKSVIYQYGNGIYQFEPVMNGQINKPASKDSLNAAKDALNGWDPTNGALYFFANYVKSKWLWSRPISKIIGNHVFTY
ncbi:MAG: LysM peptidoglycan-binding domain-containing protein [Peptococcaceae bacterium]|jgi:N-acetylmuramoyl-L-alanine amidase|nr:LysM peptidoglycan-binding domain-containing protein [Peptococcaceae bacterium]